MKCIYLHKLRQQITTSLELLEMKDVDSLANTTTHLGREMADRLVGCYCKPINTSKDLSIHFCYCVLKGIMFFF